MCAVSILQIRVFVLGGELIKDVNHQKKKMVVQDVIDPFSGDFCSYLA
jgi:hypothetical protein